MPLLVRVLVAFAALVLWLIPLLKERRRNRSETPQTVDLRSRWGVVLEALGYSLLWQFDFWDYPPLLASQAIGVVLLVFAVAVSFAAARALGSLLRIDAGLSVNHQLIRSGPYRLVRHPVYCSFLCLIVGTGLLITRWPLMLVATAVFLIGTEIRVHLEDRLLAEHFGEQFEEYRRSVSAYIPFVR
jgi:protein-S-isoprenylcysteine O-methyltransferase Ste14